MNHNPKTNSMAQQTDWLASPVNYIRLKTA